MAFTRRFARSPRRSFSRSGSRQVPRWTAQSSELLLTAAAPAQGLTLHSMGNTIGAGQYEEEGLLTRIVGRLCVQATDNGTVLGGPIGLGIAKAGTAAPTVGGVYDPLVATELAARDWLGVYNLQVPVNSGPQAWQRIQELDIRVKRRMKAEDLIQLFAVNGTGDDITITIDVRILIVIRL